MLTIKINEIDRSTLVRFGSVQITDRINQASDVASFTIDQYGSQTFKPSLNDEVIIELDGERIYGGVIISVEQSMDHLNTITHDVQCKDFTQYMDRLLVTERYQNQTLNYIVLDLIDRYGDDYGFTTDNVTGDTVEIKSITFNEIPLSECFNKLAKLTTYYWYVDYFKDLHVFKKNEELAPFNLLDDSGNYIYDSLRINEDLSQIRNVVKIRGGEAIADERTELLTGDGEKDTFPLGNKFSELPVVEVDGSPVTVGLDFLDNDADFDAMWSFQQKYIRFTAGNIPGAPISGETNIEVTGTPLKPVVVKRYDTASLAEFGTYESKTENNLIRSRDEALQFALSELTAYADAIRNGGFDTYEPGLRSGQTMAIFSEVRDIDEQFVIQSVTFRQISNDGDGLSVWHVELATLKNVSVVDILQQLILRETLVEGDDQTLLNFIQMSDSFGITDAITDVVATTTQDYVWEQGVPGSDTYTNPIVWDKFTWD